MIIALEAITQFIPQVDLDCYLASNMGTNLGS